MAAVLSVADGVSVVQESVFENRLGYTGELVKMGARIKVEGKTAIVEGVKRLVGAPVKANDLRAGASLVVAGLSAHGKTEIYGYDVVRRGYEIIDEKLRELGADVTVDPL